MDNIKIKLCGMMEKKDVEAANKLGVDYVGYIFVTGRKRCIDEALAAELTSILNDDIIPVGVFKNNDYSQVLRVAKSGTIRMIQLHGREDEEFIKKIKEETGLPVIKAFGVADPEDIVAANKSSADFVILDTPGGGTGFLFDHDHLAGIKRDYFLAGGLSPDNVREILSQIEGRMPYAVDVSSGIETDARKDVSKMQAFVRALKEA